MTQTTTRWTPAQAGYQPDTLHVEAGGIPQHYLRTRHGIVVRNWCGTQVVEIILKRPRNTGGTYQGTVRAVPGGWQGFDDHNGQPTPVTAVHANYLDAEAPMLIRKTGHAARGTYRWTLATTWS